MKVLITGYFGLLGQAVARTAPPNTQIVGISRNIGYSIKHQIVAHNLSSPIDFKILPFGRPDIVIHCAAEGNVDKVQKNPDIGVRDILTATKNVIQACQGRPQIKLVHISSNAIYHGDQPLYNEKSPISPVNIYGNLKATCETLVQNAGNAYIIIRPLLLYGQPFLGRRGNLITALFSKLVAREEITIASNTVTQPLLVDDCAKAIWTAIEKDHWREFFNLAGPNRLTIGDIAHDIANLLDDQIGYGTHKLIKPVLMEYYNPDVPRPRDTSFDISYAQNKLDFTPTDLRIGIKQFWEQLNNPD